MERIKKIINERKGGLFLLSFAALIVVGLSISSRHAESKSGQNPASVNQASNEGQDSGVNNNIDPSPETASTTEESDQNSAKNSSPASQNQVVSGDSSNASSSNDGALYLDLKNSLKKYCGKKFNVKKCQDYLLKTKKARDHGSRFKTLYKKYHFDEQEKTSKSSSDSSSSSSNNNNNSSTSSSDQTGASDQSQKWTLVVDKGSSGDTFTSSASVSNVIDLMDALVADKSDNFSYHQQSSGFVDEINGLKNEGDMSWMLYTCKGSTCKLSSVGASDCKVGDWDKVEWKYLDWTTMDWTTW